MPDGPRHPGYAPSPYGSRPFGGYRYRKESAVKIVDRDEFLKCPDGTIFAKFGGPEGNPDDAFFGEVCIMGGACGPDFVVQDLTAQFEGWTGSESHFDELNRMMADPSHESPPLDYDSAGRDGFFDRQQRFAVWSREDARRLIARLNEAFETAYGEPAQGIVSRQGGDADAAPVSEAN